MGDATVDLSAGNERDALLAFLEGLMEDAPDWPLFERPGWHADAACREHPLELFFPRRRRGHPVRDTVAEAKRVCAGCLVRDDCRAWALARGAELRGVWAGLSEHDRQVLRRAAQPVPALARSA